MPSNDTYYDSTLESEQIESALVNSKKIADARSSGNVGEVLMKTADGYEFGSVGGSIDTILVNGVEQPIVDKAVDLEVVEGSDFEQFQQSVQAKFDELGLYRDAQGYLCEY